MPLIIHKKYSPPPPPLILLVISMDQINTSFIIKMYCICLLQEQNTDIPVILTSYHIKDTYSHIIFIWVLIITPVWTAWSSSNKWPTKPRFIVLSFYEIKLKWCCCRPALCTLFRLNWVKQLSAGDNDRGKTNNETCPWVGSNQQTSD